MAFGLEHRYRVSECTLAYQQIIGVKGRKGEDRNAGAGQRSGQGGEDSGEGEIQGALDLQSSERALTLHVGGDSRVITDDGELVRSAGDGTESAAGPAGNGVRGG